MAAVQRHFLCGTILLFLAFSAASARLQPPVSDALTAYDMLERFHFPKGILPEGVQRYALKQDGSFEVFLSGDCQFKLSSGGYLLRYNKRITGRLETDSLSRLSGVSVKVLFGWIDVSNVVRSGDDINFHVGPTSASFPVSNFAESPECGCGFLCGSAAA